MGNSFPIALYKFLNFAMFAGGDDQALRGVPQVQQPAAHRARVQQQGRAQGGHREHRQGRRNGAQRRAHRAVDLRRGEYDE